MSRLYFGGKSMYVMRLYMMKLLLWNLPVCVFTEVGPEFLLDTIGSFKLELCVTAM